MNLLIRVTARFITPRVQPTLMSFVEIVSAVAPPRDGEIYGTRAFIINFVFLLLDTCTDTFGGLFPPKTSRTSPPMGKSKHKLKAQIPHMRLKIGMMCQQSMSMNLRSPFQDSLNENYVRRPPAEITLWRRFRLARKRHYLGNHAQ